MENGYGGPVWHASVRRISGESDPSAATRRASAALAGVGDAASGEWFEQGYDGASVHIKRRLASSEWLDAPWGMDLRGTRDGRQRILAAGTPMLIAQRIGEW